MSRSTERERSAPPGEAPAVGGRVLPDLTRHGHAGESGHLHAGDVGTADHDVRAAPEPGTTTSEPPPDGRTTATGSASTGPGTDSSWL
ncbi:hypothetical protein [Streptomyces sp. NPDC046859]|uniref:hypothetical protein n=1 Tax=Streptomyces sp. NPDC046859 TaxID=3155734 RepID=UPI0033FD00BA